MQAIEFQTITHNRHIRLPDEIPDGMTIRVLLLVDELKDSDKVTHQKLNQLTAQLEQAEQDIALKRYVELNKAGVAQLFTRLKQR
jgi:hypothetical protein